MKNKFYTVMVVPSTTSKVKKVKLSGRLLNSFVVLVSITVILSAYFCYDYIRIKKQVSEVDNLRSETRIQRLKINNYAQQIIDVEKEMSRLRKFDATLRVIFDLDKHESQYQGNSVAGIGGAGDLQLSEYPEILEGKISDLNEQIDRDLTRLKLETASQELSLSELVDFLQDQRSLLRSMPSIWPAKGYVSSGYRRRIDPFTGRWAMHHGIDVATNQGAPIIAPADGVVTYIGRKVGFGKLLGIDHGYGYTTRYGHNSRIDVKVGQKVKRGQVIAYVGNTGRSTGPHLHYEIRKDGMTINPLNYILN